METDYYSCLFINIIPSITLYMPTAGVIVAIVADLLLLFGSALMSGSEAAYFSLKPTDIETLKRGDHKGNQQVLDHLQRSDYLLATILIGNNFVNVGVVM